MGKRLAVMVLVVAVTATALAACVPLTSVTVKITPPAQNPTVIQRNATLTVPAGTYGMATASCPTGATMVSGGWSTTAYLPANTLAVLASYPSDSTGAPPFTQGQAETSWTVRATNPTTVPATYTVSVDCLVGVSSLITNGVWFQTAEPDLLADPSGRLHEALVECPDTVSAVTGGGFDYQPPSASAPSYGTPFAWSLGLVDGTGNLAWQIFLNNAASATGFAVCVTAPDITQAPFEHGTDATANETSIGQFQADATAGCPQNEVLSGGGFELSGVPAVNGSDQIVALLNWPLTTDALAPGTSPTWHVTLNNSVTAGSNYGTYTPGAYGLGDVFNDTACLQLLPPPHIRFNFSNYHHLLRIPADIVAATDGSGQVKATLVTSSVSRVQTGAIDAVPTTNQSSGRVMYSVPASCGDPTPAIEAATAALMAQLKRAIPAGQVAFSSPSISINRGSLTCSPAAGTQRTSPFTYTQAIDGSASQGTYKPGDVLTYQMRQLQAAARQLGSPYVLGNTLVCPLGPSLQSATTTHATIACAAYGVAEWPWSDQALRALAAQLVGKTQSQALAILNETPGIEPSTAQIAFSTGTTITNLPTNPDQITIFVAVVQDTSPVIRTP